MFGSLKLGKFFGIDTYIHGTFWLLPLFVLFQTMSAGVGVIAFNLAFVFAVFFCVALHEVGHALAGRMYGIATRDITLYPVGGVASLERIPNSPKQEVVIALAGPAVNVVIALAVLVGLLVFDAAMPWVDITKVTSVAELFAHRVFEANVFLCLFNLLPCFPMDGGRVLRAVLASRTTRLRATEIAVKVGTVVAVGMVVAGFARGNINLVLVAAVVWMLGQAELAGVRLMEAGRAAGFYDEPGAAPVPGATPLPVDPAADLAARRFSGLAWDTKRRVWVQWANGVPVRDIPT